MSDNDDRIGGNDDMDAPVGAFAFSARQVEVLLKSVVTSIRLLERGLERGGVTVETDDPDISPRDALTHDLEVLHSIGEGIVFMCKSLGLLDVDNIQDEVARAEMQNALSALEKTPALTPEMIDRFFGKQGETND